MKGDKNVTILQRLKGYYYRRFIYCYLQSPLLMLGLKMIKKLFCVLIFYTTCQQTHAFEWKVNSIRGTFSVPQTFHSLVYTQTNPEEVKINFELEPINNERFGIFVDLNGVEIGYAIDFINDSSQTETEDFLFSYKGFRHSKITFNYQTLEGFETNALNLLNESQQESQFLPGTKSTKFELFGIHDLYTFFGDSLFEHFFLNRPQLSQVNKFGLSLISGWSYKNLSLETDNNLLFQPNYLTNTVQTIKEIRAESIDVSIGPLLSINLTNNVHMFAEAKFGKGYFRNVDEETQLKRSGSEDLYSIGGGISWTMGIKQCFCCGDGKRKADT
jgi:hypothetical protein